MGGLGSTAFKAALLGASMLSAMGSRKSGTPGVMVPARGSWGNSGYKRKFARSSGKSVGRRGKRGSKKAAPKQRALVRTISKVARKIHSEGKSVGVYKKLLPEWRYHLSSPGPGGSAENCQGVSETYFNQPYELLDGVSVLFNSKTAAADYTVQTDNFTGDPDFRVISARCYVHLQSTSQLPFDVDVYAVTPKQDSDTSALARWQLALNEVAVTTVNHFDMGVTPGLGSMEFSRYWYHKKVKTVRLEPGKRKYVGLMRLQRNGINWENMKYGGNVIGYKKGVTTGFVFIQRMPIQYNSSGNKIGVPAGGWGGFIIQKDITYRMYCPDVAAVTQNKDKLMYLNNYSTTLGTTVYPSKPEVANIPVQNQ